MAMGTPEIPLGAPNTPCTAWQSWRSLRLCTYTEMPGMYSCCWDLSQAVASVTKYQQCYYTAIEVTLTFVSLFFHLSHVITNTGRHSWPTHLFISHEPTEILRTFTHRSWTFWQPLPVCTLYKYKCTCVYVCMFITQMLHGKIHMCVYIL